VSYFELTLEEEPETCQSVADCPPLPLQDPVGSGLVCEQKGSPHPAPEAAKSGCSLAVQSPFLASAW
jgi:hypothetical protein